MVLRTARSGRNAGRDFWGCSHYPACKEIVILHPPADNPPSPSRRTTWSDAGRRPGWTGFYAPAGGRLRSLNLIDPGRAPTPVRRAASQAAFFLTDHPRGAIDDRLRVIVDVARRLLTRGVCPPADGLVESWTIERAGLAARAQPPRDPGDLSLRLPLDTLPSATELLRAVAHREPLEPDLQRRLPDGSPAVDPDSEQPFLVTLATELGGAAQYVTPQAAFGALFRGTSGDMRRADFLVCHPATNPLVVEIDGAQHERAREVDRDRDQALRAAGIETIRVRTVDDRKRAAAQVAATIASVSSTPRDDLLALVWAPVVAARVARALVEAVANGWLNGDTWRIDLREPLGVGRVALRSAVEILAAVGEVWGRADLAPDQIVVASGDRTGVLVRVDVGRYEEHSLARLDTPPDLEIVVEPYRGPWHALPERPGIPTVIVRSASLPIDLADTQTFRSFARRVPDASRVSSAALTRLLNAVFAKREFYPADTPPPRGQEVAVRRLLDGRDTAVLLPTGAGKSLIYQLAGLLLPGVTIVVDPIVALIDDQIEGLAAQGIDRAIGITGADTRAGRTEAKLTAVGAGDAIFCLIAPQRLQSRAFRDALRMLAVTTPLSIAVVDEAHCVSEWGHTFMPAYLGMAQALREIGADLAGEPPPLLALTGTASRAVLRDMLVELEMDRSDPGTIVIPASFDRPELSYSVVSARDDEVLTRLLGALRSLPGHFGVNEAAFFEPNGPDTSSGIVFVQTVNPSKRYPDLGVMKVQNRLQATLRVPVGIYSGSAPRGFAGDWDNVRRDHARAFKYNEEPVLVATKAFGMGIDKPNIRFTVHLGIPGSIEAYYQEAGRAGRDRQPARCLIVHDPGDSGFWEWAHDGSFKGVKADVAAITRALTLIGELGEARRVEIPGGPIASAEDGDDTGERAIHRLRLLGVVADYTVDWGGGRFELRLADVTPEALDAALLTYIRRTQPGRVAAFEKSLAANRLPVLQEQVIRNARHLVGFVYDTVAEARKQALIGMRKLADESHSDAEIRDRILAYLELGKIAGELEMLIDMEPFEIPPWQALYLRLDTIEDGHEWRGATTRFLESAPDHPGLLVGRALAESVVPEGDVRLFSSSLTRALQSAGSRYLVKPEDLAQFTRWLVEWLHDRKPSWGGLAMLVAERSESAAASGLGDGLERRLIRDMRVEDPHELAMALTRIQDQYVQALAAAGAKAREVLTSE